MVYWIYCNSCISALNHKDEVKVMTHTHQIKSSSRSSYLVDKNREERWPMQKFVRLQHSTEGKLKYNNRPHEWRLAEAQPEGR